MAYTCNVDLCFISQTFQASGRGRQVYVAQPPLFRIDQGKDIYYALDEKEKDDLVKKLTTQNKRTKVEIQRFKGLGEMNPSQLKETTMSQDVRKLLQLKLEKGNSATTMFNMLLSKKELQIEKVG